MLVHRDGGCASISAAVLLRFSGAAGMDGSHYCTLAGSLVGAVGGGGLLIRALVWRRGFYDVRVLLGCFPY